MAHMHKWWVEYTVLSLEVIFAQGLCITVYEYEIKYESIFGFTSFLQGEWQTVHFYKISQHETISLSLINEDLFII